MSVRERISLKTRKAIKFQPNMLGKGIDFNDATFPAGSSNNLLSFGDGVGSVNIAVDDYHFLIRLNVVNTSNPTVGQKLFSWLFLKFAQSTEDQANLDFQGLGLTCELSKNIGYAHVVNVFMNITETLTVSQALHGVKSTIHVASGKTVTSSEDYISAVFGEMSGAGTFGAAVAACLEAKTKDSAAVEAGLYVNPLNGTSMAAAIHLGGGASGNITNVFNFARDGGSKGVKIGPGCDTDGADSDGAIRIVIAGTEYFIPFFSAGNTSSSW